MSQEVDHEDKLMYLLKWALIYKEEEEDGRAILTTEKEWMLGTEMATDNMQKNVLKIR